MTYVLQKVLWKVTTEGRVEVVVVNVLNPDIPGYG